MNEAIVSSLLETLSLRGGSTDAASFASVALSMFKSDVAISTLMYVCDLLHIPRGGSHVRSVIRSAREYGDFRSLLEDISRAFLKDPFLMNAIAHGAIDGRVFSPATAPGIFVGPSRLVCAPWFRSGRLERMVCNSADIEDVRVDEARVYLFDPFETSVSVRGPCVVGFANQMGVRVHRGRKLVQKVSSFVCCKDLACICVFGERSVMYVCVRAPILMSWEDWCEESYVRSVVRPMLD
jgi:hypothetical protein